MQMLLPKFISSFKVLEGELEGKPGELKRKMKSGYGVGTRSSSSPNAGKSMAVGLRILTQTTPSSTTQAKSHVVVKPAVQLKIKTGSNTTRSAPTTLEYSCFLKTCYSCNKKFSPDKDIYMYRGDQGFCSIECRNRQMVLDEIREFEASNKQRIVSSHSYGINYCRNDARTETRSILEDLLRLRQNKSKPIPSNQNHWTIVS